MLDKNYNPAQVEEALYAAWEQAGIFAAHPQSDKRPYTIMMPPPNVTGSLHVGHALTFTLQDILVRYHRMIGRDVLWQPGTDHAGIATQMVVERQLAESGTTRQSLGREAFVKRVWSWKEQSGGVITHQLRRLGASPDWARERFTMDEGLSKAVRKVFVELYRQGLIYRDKRLVSWDPKLQTAISDLEVENREVKGKMWYFKYPIEGRDGGYLTVGTTRPETMLGDTAVAVHPDDERYKDLVGMRCRHPILGSSIPIIADKYADPEKGSGAVKITPAHDFNDYEVGRRNNLQFMNIFDRDARVVDTAPIYYLRSTGALDPEKLYVPEEKASGEVSQHIPPPFAGLGRFEARKAIVAKLEELGLLEKIEDNTMTVPYGDRSGVVIEPWLTDQWYCDAATLAVPCIKAVEDGRTRFVPKTWENTFFEWMRNIQPWCISRQLWWGHQIPIWYGFEKSDDGQTLSNRIKVFAAESEAEALDDAKSYYGGKNVELVADIRGAEIVFVDGASKPSFFPIWRDPDVLDTWFSSALWPFSTLGWPDKTPELAKYYPGDVLVTAFDIIFFWVARMMMMGMHFMGDVPFRDVYIHALVRDEKGQKMSKSKGNVMDPLDLCNSYGTDAVRFTLAAMAAQGRDIKLAESRIAGYRNFVTKIWNAARFCQMNGCAIVPGFDPKAVTSTVNKWIVAKTAEAARTISTAIEAYRFNDAANGLYQFTWGTFCDWYLEFTKPVFQGTDEALKAETRATTAWALDHILILGQPIIPFVTHELWDRLAEAAGITRPCRLIEAPWPELGAMVAAEAQSEIDWVVETVSAIRSVRSEMNVPPAALIAATVSGASPVTRRRLEAHGSLICANARLASIQADDSAVPNAAQVVVGEATVLLPLAGIIDFDKERARLKKEISTLEGMIAAAVKKLSNESFVAKAPPEIIQENRDRQAAAEAEKAKLLEALTRIGGG